ncbi:MAG: radical SAM family heme chaperone HemW [Actinobacteria bacterium]|nr:radical SAM family heme chaperone HemW [Actinomycetota bacterium]
MATGLYTHIPFCIRKCHYCDFTSLPVEEEAASQYIRAFMREAEIRAGLLQPEQKALDSVYVGGGTPTCLPGDSLIAVLESIFFFFNVSGSTEITVEANPGTVDFKKMLSLRRSGVNRISIGFQSCRQELLDTLGRIHSFSQAREAFWEAREAGFDNINIDLIFGIPGQTPGHWESCLKAVGDLRPEHISAYSLQLEEGTPLYDRVRGGALEQCPEDTEAEMYELLIDFLKEKGYLHYEISNFALPGRACRHNLRYWRGGEYLGLGPSAHSYLGGRRFSNRPDLKGYIDSLESGKLPVDWEEEVDLKTAMSEAVFLGLRLIEGLDTGEYRKRFGREIEDVYGEPVRRLENQGLIGIEGGCLRLTRRGLMLGNRVFSEFV